MQINTEKFKEEFDKLLQAECGFEEQKSAKAVYNALSKAVMLNLSKEWKDSRNAHKKRCGYFSAEFLIGRMVFSNLLA